MNIEPDNLETLQANVQCAAGLLRALANEHRLVVLCALRHGELSVGDLVKRVGLSQSALSQHLGRLRQEDLVATRRSSQTIYYRIADPDVLELILALASAMAHRKGKMR